MNDVLRLRARIDSVSVQGVVRPRAEVILHCDNTEAVAELVRSVGAECEIGLVIDAAKPGLLPH